MLDSLPETSRSRPTADGRLPPESSLVDRNAPARLWTSRSLLQANEERWASARPETPFRDVGEAIEAQLLKLDVLQRVFMENLPPEEWRDAVGGKVREPVLILSHTLASLPTAGG